MATVHSDKISKSDARAEELRQRFADIEPELLERLTELVVNNATKISEAFYAAQAANPETRRFLDNQTVEVRLKPFLQRWMIELFSARTAGDFGVQVERQKEIAKVHARIGVNVHLVSSGMRTIKHELGLLIASSDLDRLQVVRAVQGVNDILDEAQDLINDVYLDQLIEFKRNEQSFRFYSMGHNIETEGQRIRASLFDWLRSILTLFHTGNPGAIAKPPRLAKSEFGLWLTHKAELIVPDAPEIEDIIDLVDTVDATLAQASQIWDEVEINARSGLVQSLNDTVNNIDILIDSMIQRALEFSGGRDALTHLLNRRYLPSLIQREVNVSIQRGLRFAILLLDLDHFKSINDTHGHDAGDAVLRQVAESITSRVRAADFVFRYGGEEILVLLAEVNEEQAFRVGEILRETIAATPVRIGGGEEIKVTTSIGIALHDGHPDYERVISAADRALYEAKNGGRNRCVVADTASK